MSSKLVGDYVMKVSILAGGGGDTYYEYGLTSALAQERVHVDFIGSDFLKDAEVLRDKYVSFYNLRGDQNPSAPGIKKILRVLKYYVKLIRYAYVTDSKLFHLQWCNKFVHFDRTILNIYYKLLGKKLVFTAHNVNAAIRDGKDSFLNRLTLRFMYKIMDHIFVHTVKMKQQLVDDFNIEENKITLIPYGINDKVYKSDLTSAQARKKLDLEITDQILLFFGVITPYKGLEYLLHALDTLNVKNTRIKLLIAGEIDARGQNYWRKLQSIIEEYDLRQNIIGKTEFIPDNEVEIYFKAADILILPYKYIFQSGILFLAYNFGLPVIASDVGSLREFVVEEDTGYICKPEDMQDLAEKINIYFRSDLYRNLQANRNKIMKYAKQKYSWKQIGEETCLTYRKVSTSQ
jgi:glycosyltransferase involved in cell wall biosynthesis